MYLHHRFLETVYFLVWEKRAKLFHHPFLPSRHIRFSLSIPPCIAKPKLLVRKKVLVWLVLCIINAVHSIICVQHNSVSFLHHFVFMEFFHFWACFISIVRNPLNTRRCTKAQPEKERPRHRAEGASELPGKTLPCRRHRRASC